MSIGNSESPLAHFHWYNKEKSMKKMIAIFTLLFVGAAVAGEKTQAVKVEVMEEGTSLHGEYQAAGFVGAVRGKKTYANALDIKTMINGDHALLRCYENHQGCNILGPGTYDGEIKVAKHQSVKSGTNGMLDSGKGSGPDVWIHYVQPLDHKVYREHWKVSGTW
jgi:hypothetical protein